VLKKTLKTVKGFTLVEVIVVAVIVAVLAAVAIPLYLNYVNSSRTNSAENTAGSAASFCAACINGGGVASQAGQVLSCTGGTGDGTTFTIPTKITLTFTGFGSGSAVTGTHADGGAASQAYSF